MNTKNHLLIGSHDTFIATATFNDGQLEIVKKHTTAPNPSWLISDRNKNIVFCVSETESAASVSSYLHAQEDLQLISTQATAGQAPCHLSLDAHNNLLFCSDYLGKGVSAFCYDDEGVLSEAILLGHLGENFTPHSRQDSHHPHCSLVLDGFLFVCDLGDDTIYRWRIDKNLARMAQSQPAMFKTPAGSGPRHMAFDRQASLLYISTELSSDILLYDVDENCDLHFKAEVSALAHNSQERETCSEIILHPSLDYGFVANRGRENNICIFKRTAAGPTVVAHHPLTHKEPRHMSLSPDGKYLLVALDHDSFIEIIDISVIETPKTIGCVPCTHCSFIGEWQASS